MGRAGLRALRLLGRSAPAWHRPLLLLRAAVLGRRRRRLLLDGAAFRLGLRPLLLTLLPRAAPLRLRLRSRAALLLTLLRRWLRLLHLL